MALRRRNSASHFSVDPAEKWEVLLTEKDAGSYFESTYASRPYTPHRPEELPVGSWESLADACCIDDLRQVLIIPWAVRPVGLGRREVISPNSVLAVGSRAVGLWTEKPEPGLKVILPVEEIAAIEDVIILLYGRLSFIPFSERLTIRYNTVCRRGLDPSLLTLRKRLAGPAQHVAGTEEAPPRLSYKWNNVLNSHAVRLESATDVAYAFSSLPRRSRRDEEHGELVALTPHELVFLCDPPSDFLQYGEDSFIIPRGKLESVTPTNDGLDVSSNHARVVLPMTRVLQESVLRWIG